jgi:hypothetical protein
MNNFTFGDEGVGYYETIAGGAGAGPGWHGRSGVHPHKTNTRRARAHVCVRVCVGCVGGVGGGVGGRCAGAPGPMGALVSPRAHGHWPAGPSASHAPPRCSDLT